MRLLKRIKSWFNKKPAVVTPDDDFASEVAEALAGTVPGGEDMVVDEEPVLQPSAVCMMTASEYVAEGKKVNAIKAVRADTGWGLKEAKQWVNDNCPELPLTDLTNAVSKAEEEALIALGEDGATEPTTIGDLIRSQMEPHLTESQMAGDDSYSLPSGETK